MRTLNVLFIPLINTIIINIYSHFVGIYGINYFIVILFSIASSFALLNFTIILFNHTIIFINIGSWFQIMNIPIIWEFQNTLITALLSLIIISVSTLIHIYSIYYMGEDNNYIKFIMLLSLFTFFMLLLIQSSQLITILIGWEAVGICSYLLINFWSTRQEANQSAIKAVLFNKIGDLGFILAIIISLIILLDTDIFNLNKLIISFSNILYNRIINLIQILSYSLILAAFGKSAQFFFHLWLTDAMEGPTPVSGLIHSATMVIAGVFLVIQLFAIIKLSSEILLIIMLVGTITTLVTSLIAATSFDIKRIIANSTASHIGLMFMSLGLGDLSVSLFHLATHAYFKAFGFLFAGYLIHLLCNEQDCRWMGGIFNLLPIIGIVGEYWCITMLNLPNSSSYYSKELFFNTYWAYSNIYLSSYIIFIAFLLCFLSFICSSLYIGYLLSWFYDKLSIKKQSLIVLYESKWLPLGILLILALLSQLTGFILYNIFLNNNAIFYLHETSLFFFLSDWNELYLLKSSFIIIVITCIIDLIEDLNNLKNNIINYYYSTTILYLTNNTTNKWFFFLKRITSFSIDSLFHLSLYNTLTKGMTLFYSIDNYLIETANHILIYKRISYYLQNNIFNKFVTQINLNFLLVILTIFYINYHCMNLYSDDYFMFSFPFFLNCKKIYLKITTNIIFIYIKNILLVLFGTLCMLFLMISSLIYIYIYVDIENFNTFIILLAIFWVYIMIYIYYK